ncbi:MFS transporter [Aurantivibrio plasticivorans]
MNEINSDKIEKGLTGFSPVVSVIGLGQSALLVLLPVLVDVGPLDYNAWAQVFAFGTVVYFVGSLWWPWVVPRLGVRRSVLLALLGNSLSWLMLWLALYWGVARTLELQTTSFMLLLWVLLSRCLYGVATSGLLPSAHSLVIHLPEAAQRLRFFARLSVFQALGRLLGPLMVMAAVVVNPLFGLLGLAGVASLMMGFVVWRLPQDLPSASASPLPWRAYLPARRVWMLLLLPLLTATLVSGLQFVIAPLLQSFGVSAQATTYWLSFLLVVVGVFSVVMHRVQIKRPPARPVYRLVWMVLLLLVCLVCVNQGAFFSIWGVAVFVVLAGVLLASLTPLYSAVLADVLSPPSLSVVLSTSHLVGHALGLSITGWLMSVSIVAATQWLVVAVLIMLSVLLWQVLLCVGGAGAPRRLLKDEY